MKLTKGLTRHKKQLYKYICMYIVGIYKYVHRDCHLLCSNNMYIVYINIYVHSRDVPKLGQAIFYYYKILTHNS